MIFLKVKNSYNKKLVTWLDLNLQVAPLIVLYFHLNERANVIDDFNNNKELICNMSSLKIDVSKADNWSVDKNSFLKGSTSIPVTKCEIKD